MAIPKPVPDRYEMLAPPVADADYRFFSAPGAPAPPSFDAVATAISPVNAWWLADCALLAYSAPAVAVPLFNRAGLQVAGNDIIADTSAGGSTQCYVVFDDAKVIVIFRGTEILKAADFSPAGIGAKVVQIVSDWAVNTDVHMQGAEGIAGGVHRGFAQGVARVWPQVETAVASLLRERPQRELFFTGHSLGAALATIATARWNGRWRGLYTYGSPRCANAEFADALMARARSNRAVVTRVVNRDDVVATVPPRAGVPSFLFRVLTLFADNRYAHVGDTLRFDAMGAPSLAAYSPAEDERDHDKPLAGPQALTDHAPVIYAVRAWNAIH